MTTIQFLAAWALRSSILILFGALLLLALRAKDASIRVAAWTAMMLGSLLIPAIVAGLPQVRFPVTHPVAASITEPFLIYDMTPAPAAASPAATVEYQAPVADKHFDWPRAGTYLYFLIALTFLLRVFVGAAMSMWLIRRSHATGQNTNDIAIHESDRITAPVTLGILRPMIVLPLDWPEWDLAKRDAILAHERSHIRRFDPAMQFLSSIHRALLWFSPLSWFLHSRIVQVAEEASDDAALAAIDSRTSYAQILLDFMQRGAPIRRTLWTGVPMARYGQPATRIHRILDLSCISRGLTWRSLMMILALAMPLTYLVASTRASFIRPVPKSAPAPVIIAQAEARAPKPTPVVTPARPKFDVASIRPCDPAATQAGGRGGKSAGSTARYRRNCVTVKTLIENAYVRFADGKNRSPTLTQLTKIEGGPSWLDADQYTIEAEADGDFLPMMMDGPMTQTLLEDRFQLKIHREAREGPVYELTPARGGLKIQPAKAGPCLPEDSKDSPFPAFQPPPEMANRQCSFSWGVRKGPNMIRAARSTTMAEFTAGLTGTMGRLVVDKTGITGSVDFRLTYSVDESTPGAPTLEQAEQAARVTADVFGVAPKARDTSEAPDPPGPSIFTALQQQLGLKLEPGKGNREYLVIDSISRPTPN